MYQTDVFYSIFAPLKYRQHKTTGYQSIYCNWVDAKCKTCGFLAHLKNTDICIVLLSMHRNIAAFSSIQSLPVPKPKQKNNKHTSFPSTAVKISLFVAAHDQLKNDSLLRHFFLAATPPDFPKYGKMPKRA